MSDREQILILDFGGQYTQLIAKAVRSLSVYSVIHPHTISSEEVTALTPQGIILSGGPDSVHNPEAPKLDLGIFKLGIPIFGISYGMQLINVAYGGKMLRSNDEMREYGETEIFADTRHPLFRELPEAFKMWMSHSDSVDSRSLPKGFRVIARSPHHVAACANDEAQVYGVQFRPELTHSQLGKAILSRFVCGICHCQPSWTMHNFIGECKKYVRETVGSREVLSFVSGGVDSTFVTAILNQSKDIGLVHAVYIDAFMRKGESQWVQSMLKQAGIKNLHVYQAEDECIKLLEGIQEPEAKRKIIGNFFGQLQQRICHQLKLKQSETVLAQGTLYTDLIESEKGIANPSHTIKSHHNVGCEFIEQLKANGQVVEPNRLIFKDEVRQAAKEIGLPKELWSRQPYPGPGLAIRIINGKRSWINAEYFSTSDAVKKIALEEGLEGFLLPVKTVGVQGDQRTYSYLAMLKGKRDWHTICLCTQRITTELQNVNRVVFDLTPYECFGDYCDKQIATGVSRNTVDQLKEVDALGCEVIAKYGFDSVISQTIFVLFGADPYGIGRRSVALRAVLSDDFMTVSPAVPGHRNLAQSQMTMSWDCLDEIQKVLSEHCDIGAFVYDVTYTPPAMMDWE